MMEKFNSPISHHENNEAKESEQKKASPEVFHNFEKKMGPQLLELSSMFQTGFKKSKEATKKITKFVFTRVLPVYMAYLGSAYFLQKELGTFSEKERARQEMLEKGITSEQQTSYKMGLSEFTYRAISPTTDPRLLTDPENALLWLGYEVVPNLVGNRREEDFNIGTDREPVSSKEVTRSSEDGWRLYLGMPQKDNTFGISDYTPEKHSKDQYYFKVNNFKDVFKKSLLHNKNYLNTDSYQAALLDYVAKIKNVGGIKVTEGVVEDFSSDSKNNLENGTLDLELLLGHYTVSVGEDAQGTYFSYYDKWDFASFTEETGRGIGTAFEIYDRIYYNPETGEIIDSLLSK